MLQAGFPSHSTFSERPYQKATKSSDIQKKIIRRPTDNNRKQKIPDKNNIQQKERKQINKVSEVEHQNHRP